MLRVVDRHLQITTRTRVASTDANIPLALGIPATTLGGGGTGGDAHTPEEWFDPTGARNRPAPYSPAGSDRCRDPRRSATRRSLAGSAAAAMTPRLRANLLLLAVVLVWGTTFVLVKDALTDISPTLFNLLRMALACAALLAVYRPNLSVITRRQWQSGAIVGACLATGYQFQTIGLRYTTASKSAFITGSVVVLVPLFGIAAWAFKRKASKRPDLRSLLGAAIAFGGLALLTLPPGPSAVSILRAVNPGDWLTFGCAFAFALHLLSLGRASKFTPYHSLAILQTGFATLFLACAMPAFEKPYLHCTPRLILALAITSVLATAMAFAIQSWAQTILPPTNTALLLTLEPVFAWITSFLFLGERLSARGWTGAALVLAGILFTELSQTPEVPPAGAA